MVCHINEVKLKEVNNTWCEKA